MYIPAQQYLTQQLRSAKAQLTLQAEPTLRPGARLQLRLPSSCHISSASENPGLVAALHHLVSLVHADAAIDLDAISAGDGLWLACEEALYRDLAASGLGRMVRPVDMLDAQDSNLPELRELFDAALQLLAELFDRNHGTTQTLC